MTRSARFIIAGLALGATAATAHAATIPVTTTADVVANDGRCSLREAVTAARFDAGTPPALNCVAGSSGEDVIQLEAAEYRLAAGGAGDENNESGDLDTGPASIVRVVGRGMNATVIGGAGDRIFDVFTGATLGLADLTVRDALSPAGANGGAVRNRGTLTVLRVAFVNTAAGAGRSPTFADDEVGDPGGGGGAIWSDGQLQVADSLFSGTRAGKGGNGGFFLRGPGSVEDPPQAGGSGGAVLITAGSAIVTGTTFTDTRAGDGGAAPPDPDYTSGGDGGDGGAIAVTGGSATVTNATFQGDAAGAATAPRLGYMAEAVPGAGGGVAAVAPGTATVTFSTFSGNAAGTSPFGVTGAGASVSGANVGASILADQGACATLAPASLANVVLPGDNTCLGARVVGDPRLGALAANGGATPTMLPGAGSPAINALVGVPCPATDQRGLPRPALGACDIGAAEIQPGTPQAVGAPVPGGGAGARTISGLTLGKGAFRAMGRKPLGTTVTFMLAADGRVVLTVTKPAAGKRSSGKCVAPSRRLRSAKRCIRQVTLPGKITMQGSAGPNTLRFSGRLRGRALAPGRYTMVLTLPKAGSAPAVSVTKGFRILG